MCSGAKPALNGVRTETRAGVCLLKSPSVPAAFRRSEFWPGGICTAFDYNPVLLKTGTGVFKYEIGVSCGEESMHKGSKGTDRALSLPLTVRS